jgi:hypothetical protein
MLFKRRIQALENLLRSFCLGVQVAAILEKVDGRERQLNGQFDGLMVQYQDTRQQLLAAQEEYNRCAAACYFFGVVVPSSSIAVPVMRAPCTVHWHCLLLVGIPLTSSGQVSHHAAQT